MDEVSTKKRKKLFKKFINKWNDGKLEERYYKTFTSLSIDNHQKTRYKWSFEKNIDSKEQMKMDLIKDQIDNETNDQIIVDQLIERFQHKFEQKRKRNENWNKNKNRNNNDDMEFENDNDGIDAAKKIQMQAKQKEKQRRQDRKQRIHDIKQKKYLEKQERDSKLLSSYQSFVSSSAKTSKKRKDNK